MADLPVEKPNLPPEKQIKITAENAPLFAVHYLAQIYGRLGYIIKLLEEKK